VLSVVVTFGITSHHAYHGPRAAERRKGNGDFVHAEVVGHLADEQADGDLMLPVGHSVRSRRVYSLIADSLALVDNRLR